jgi:putative methionine-R-sulfoxide reductase with GAF domain
MPTANSAPQAFPPTQADLDIGLDIAVRAALQQTDAAAAAIALMQDKVLVCRARLGSGAPSIGVSLNEASGITGACVRTGEVQCCSDAETDPRVNSCFCRELNVRSILVVPILEAKVVTGVVEVLSPRADAFNARHVRWLLQLAEFVQRLEGREALSHPQTTTPAQTKSVLPKMDDKAETGQLAKAPHGNGVAGQRPDGENELAVICDVLQQKVGTASWDEIGQELMSRLGDSETR